MSDVLHAFGPFRFDPRRKLLLQGGVPVALGSRAAVILASLLSAQGDVVTKDVLIDAAWPGMAVEESNLSVQVSNLRRIVGAQRIRTVERVGYQFVVEHKAAQTCALPLPSVFPSIVVAARGSDQLLAVRDCVAARLSRFHSLQVVDAQSLGNRGNTTYRAQISFTRDIRDISLVTVGLVESETGVIVWAGQFALSGEEWVEDQIAAAIESAVQASELIRGQRGNGAGAEAYWLYLRGRRTLNSSRADDNRRAFDLFMSAIALEPENCAYLAAATEAIHHRLAVGWEPLGADDKQVCRELAYRTLELAGTDAVAIALAGNALFTADEEDMGLALCRRAVRINPTSQLVLACAFHAEGWGGSMDEKMRLARLATALAPDDPAQRFAFGALSAMEGSNGDHLAALEWGQRSLAVGPGYTGGHHGVIEALVQLGRHEEAERQVGRYLAMSTGVTLLRFERGQHYADRGRIARRLDSLRRAGVPAA